MTKDQIRLAAKSNRESISAFKFNRFCKKIQKNFLQSEQYESARKIAIYGARKGEVDTFLIAKKAIKDGKKVCIPTEIDGTMRFIAISTPDEVKNFRYFASAVGVHLIEPDFVVAPVVAYNEQGYRIGSGKGHYDKYLNSRGVPAVGLAFTCQQFEFTPEQHDVRMIKIFTEKSK